MPTDWNQLGYKMASGQAGTGWMKFDEHNLKEMHENFQSGYEYCSNWQETLQWDYEVGNHIKEEVKTEFGIPTSDMKQWEEKYVLEYYDRVGEWCEGYESYIDQIQRDEKNKSSIL